MYGKNINIINSGFNLKIILVLLTFKNTFDN